jgi:Zn-finger nucleic acid-binding protein
MKCPACDHKLRELKVSDISVDACEGGCGGVWFDRFELQKVDEPHESAGELLLYIVTDDSVEVDHEARRSCPSCDDTVMMRHFYSVKMEVEVDECPRCAGFWLDYGELGDIRDEYETDEERKRAADEYFDEIFGHQLADMRASSEDKIEKARRIARLFRFVCPSYYIPGKQKWGAF